MSSVIFVEKSKRSSVKRIPFLPRIGVVVDFGGRQFSYRYAPNLETLFNLIGKAFTIKGLKEIVNQQLAEIEFSKQEKFTNTIGGSHEKNPKTKRRMYRPV